MRRYEDIDLGHSHLFKPTYDKDDNLVGFTDDHINAKDPQNQCGGAGLFDTDYAREKFPGRAVWKLEGEWPKITLSPSLLCTNCGDHGWVRNGLWFPA